MAKVNGKITLKSIADEVGVTPSVVSRVMRNNSSTIAIGQQTKQKILDLAIEKGIRLNNNIAVFIPGFHPSNESYFYSFLAGVMLQANKYNFGVFCEKNNSSDQKSDSSIPDFLLKKEVNAGIFFNNIPNTFKDYFESERIPFVIANPVQEVPGENSVVFDDYGTMQKLLKHLEKQDYRSYYMISYAPESSYVRSRIACFNEFIRDASYTGRVITSESDALTEIPSLVKSSTPETVFIADARLYTMKILEHIALCGKKLPEDIGLVGSPLLADFYRPKLTTVTNPNFEMGAACIDMVSNIWDKKNQPCNNVIIKGELIINGSTMRNR